MQAWHTPLGLIAQKTAVTSKHSKVTAYYLPIIPTYMIYMLS